jgi:hypothetical protein
VVESKKYKLLVAYKEEQNGGKFVFMIHFVIAESRIAAADITSIFCVARPRFTAGHCGFRQRQDPNESQPFEFKWCVMFE